MKVLHILYSDIGGTFDVVHSIIKKNSNSYWTDQVLLTGPNLFNSYKSRVFKLKIKLDYVKTIRTYIDDNRKVFGTYSEIQNQLDELVSTLNSTVYKLTNLK